MRAITIGLVMLPPLLVAIYTINYGRWARRQGLYLGAAGLFLLAALAVAAPILVLIWNE